MALVGVLEEMKAGSSRGALVRVEEQLAQARAFRTGLKRSAMLSLGNTLHQVVGKGTSGQGEEKERSLAGRESKEVREGENEEGTDRVGLREAGGRKRERQNERESKRDPVIEVRECV